MILKAAIMILQRLCEDSIEMSFLKMISLFESMEKMNYHTMGTAAVMGIFLAQYNQSPE